MCNFLATASRRLSHVQTSASQIAVSESKAIAEGVKLGLEDIGFKVFILYAKGSITKEFVAFWEELQILASKYKENVLNRTVWKEEFDLGKSPAEAFFEEYPEHSG